LHYYSIIHQVFKALYITMNNSVDV